MINNFGLPMLVLLFAGASQLLYGDCLSPSDSYEVMACKTTAAFASKHLARTVTEAQTRATERRSGSTFLQPNSANSSQIVDIYNSRSVQRCPSRTMQVWSCSYIASTTSSTCTASTQTLYFSKHTGTGGAGKIYHLDSNPTARQYGTLGTCTFR
jgi:hypothetical protein